MQPSLFNIEKADAPLECHELPDGWQWVRFGKIVTIGSGQVSPLEEPYRYYPHVGPENIEAHTGRLVNVRTAEEQELISGKYLFDDQAIVYAKIRPNLNKVCTPDFVGICSADAYPIWPDTDVVLKSYLAYYMRTAVFVKQTVATSMRSGMPKVNRDDLVRVWFALPPIKEQEIIIRFVNDWQLSLNLIHKVVEAKSRYKRALVEQLLTRKHVFPEFKGHNWRQYRLGELFTERIEMSRPDLKLLAITGTEGIVDRNSLVKRDTSNADKSKYLRVAPGDIAYNTMRMWQGVFGLSALEGIVSPAYTVCTPNERIEGRFAAYLFKLPATIALFHRHSQGLVSDTLNCKFPSFAKIKVTIPPIAEQRKIADVLELVDEEIVLLRRELDALKQQKQELMQKLLTGQVRVKEFRP
jgi:type I restriction enzyme S subunit